MRLTLVPVLTALALFQPTTSWAQTAGSVQARGAWVRATPPGATTSAFYVTLTSSRNDKLVGASSPIALRSSVHETSMTGGMMEMRPVEGGLTLPAGQPVALAPRGLHIMMEGLKSPLKAGMTVPMHLTFENSPGVDINAPVRPIGAVNDGSSVDNGMRGMDMGH